MQLVDNVIKYHPMTCNYKWEKARENSPHQIFIDLFLKPNDCLSLSRSYK